MAFTMPYSSRKVYDAELMQLDTMLARMGPAEGFHRPEDGHRH